MRGKNILWLTMIATLLCVTVADLGYAQDPATISLDPMLVTGYLPGDLFSVNVMITGAENVFAWGVELQFAPYVNLLAVNSMVEGSFLQAGGETYFASYVDAFKGLLKMGGTLVGGGSGVSGDGDLATIIFQVVEAGECPLELFNTELLDPDLFPLEHTLATMYVGDLGPYTGYYLGPTSLLVMGKVDTRIIRLSKRTYQGFDSKAKNNATVPLYTRVNYHMTRLEDGRVEDLYTAPDVYTLAVNGYTGDMTGWTMVGTDPYLDGYEFDPGWPGFTSDGSYLTTNVIGAESGYFDFEDITVQPGKSYGVTLDLRATLEDVDGMYGWYHAPTGAWRYQDGAIRAYIWDGTSWGLRVMFPYGWIYGYFYGDGYNWGIMDISDILDTADKINNAQMYLEYVPGERYVYEGICTPNWIDAAQLTVYEWGEPLAPDENRDMSRVEWAVTEDEIGTWVVEISAIYRYYLPPANPALPAIWNRALKVKTLTFRVLP